MNDTAVSVGATGEVPLIAGANWRFERQVLPGERIRARSMLLEQRAVNGRHAGPSTLQKVRVEYLDSHDHPISSVIVTLMRVDPKRACESVKYASWQRWKYSEAELIAIEKGYDEEQVRADVPRHANDIRVGEELPRIVRGPLTSEEMTLFTGSTRPVAPISEFLRSLRDGTGAGFIHPRTGTFETHAAGMVDDESARQLGFPAAHDYGIDRVSQAGSLLANWMGDHGRLRSLDVRLLSPCMLGDATWFSGKVTAVKIDGDRFMGAVSVDIAAVNQRGENTVCGSAVVELPAYGPSGQRGSAA